MTSQSPLQSIQTPDLLQERLARLKAEFPDLFTNEGQLNPTELLRLTGQQGREHFDFQWWGKAAAKRKAFTPTTAALRYDEARSVNPDKAGGNAIIEGENLEVLKLLLCAYRGQVKCIYIDPPYNTGNDFVYKDNFAEGKSAYWEQTGVTEGGVKMSTNTKADGRFHSNWLNMIYPRLLVARQLLREDGVIFVSIDDNEVTHLRKVMDEVFGEGNFVGTFVWKRRASTAMADKQISTDHEYAIAYGMAAYTAIGVPKSYENFTNFDNDTRGEWVSGDLTVGMGKDLRPNQFFPLIDPKTGKVYQPNPNRVWAYIPESMNKLIKENRILFPEDSNRRPMVKRFKSELKSEKNPISTWMTEVPTNSVATREIREVFPEGSFDYPKSTNLLSHLIKTNTLEEDLVLDFFAGSGTTAHAAIVSNRKFILVQIPESSDEASDAYRAGFKKISDITIERVKRVIQGYGDNPQPIDAGFKVFTLEKSVFPRADFAPDPDTNEAVQLAALKAFIADKEASLFNTLDVQAVHDEMLLKCGFQLDVQLTPIAEVTANQLYRARDQQTPPREAIVCFESQLDTITLEWLGQQKGQRVIVLETALDTTGKWNLHHQLGDALVVF
jgi:adenine-specific DNA-methyltransferase